jgi:DNA polymerase-3 subunit alpha
VINACTGYLRREIDIVRPPVIVALGSAVARHFVNDLKGGIVEHAGKTFYSPALDATIMIGISPGMIAFDESKQQILNDIFKQIAELIR